MRSSHILPFVSMGLIAGAGLFLAPVSAQADKATIPAEDVDISLTGDPERGEALFHMCAQCHSLTPLQNRLGPSLHDVVGREAGALDRFRYSSAMMESGIIWTPEEIDRFIKNPNEMVPRTRMAFTGISDPQQRADIIAYIIANSN